MNSNIYNSGFYEKQKDDSLSSAKVILPLVLDAIKPSSVVDVGCGIGTWLSVCVEAGVRDYWGIDGQDVDKSMLCIDASLYRRADLAEPLDVGRTFDLAISMEVAEHIPADREQVFIDSLVRLAPAVLFSAAIPYQGGIHHVNECWQDHWMGMFEQRGYAAVDLVRNKVWNNPAVMYWYAQNSFLYIRKDRLADYPVAVAAMGSSLPVRIVHPRLFDGVAAPEKMALKRALRALPHAAVRILKRLFSGKR